MLRVSQLQVALNAPKNQVNKFGGYKYRSCEDILSAVKPLLKEYQLALTVGDEIIQLGDRFYIKSTATLRDTESAAFIENTAFAREAASKKGMDESQITGSASSYARKYALNGLLCIDDTKDADADELIQKGSNPSKEQHTVKPGPQSSKPPVCYDCGREILPSHKKDGSPWPIEEIIKYSTTRFGRWLCPDCQRRAYNAERANDRAAG